MLSRSQMKMIFVLAKELSIDDAMLHTYVFNATGSNSIASLTLKEANVVIDGLKAFKLDKEGGPVKGKANARQINYINDLSEKLGWGKEPYRLKGFIKKYAGVEELSWLSSKQASNVIEGLKKLIEKGDYSA